MNKKLAEAYRAFKGIKNLCVLRNEPMSKHTTFRIGGPADLLVIPKSAEALKRFIERSDRLPISVIGNGSNVLVSDSGIRGIVLKLSRTCNGMEFNRNRVNVSAGVLISSLLNRTAKAGLSGLEFSAGIPGTVGGAVVTNMGSFGRSISQLIDTITMINRSGREIVMSKKDLKFLYRRVNIAKNKGLIVSAVLRLRRAKRNLIMKRIRHYLKIKKDTQPLAIPSAGCVFKNPKGRYAGKMIEEAECKGLRVGGAEISKTHANYILNLGDATCYDVRQLAKKVRKKVRDKFGITLKYEIIDSNHLNMLS